jgi:DeoR/GlpR family transcriptional regulator of sugar metabolism
MDLNPDEARIKQEMAAACERVVGILDRSKWQRSGLLSFVPADRVDAIVTAAGASPELVRSWREHGVEVVEAEPRRDRTAPERLPELRRLPPGDAA